MKLLVALACMFVSCLAKEPSPCKGPPLLTGKLYIQSHNDHITASGGYVYDAIGERVRLTEVVILDNQTHKADVLMDYKKQVLYDIHVQNKTCKKFPLKSEFIPLNVPGNATFMSQFILGDASYPGDGLLVNTWTGDLPKKEGKFYITVTDSRCAPVSLTYPDQQFGWLQISYLDNVVGITDPSLLIPPSFCPEDDSSLKGEPMGLIKFLKQRK